MVEGSGEGGQIVVGSRVKIKNPDRYVSAVSRLRDRVGTVKLLFTPQGSNSQIARVAFDFKRGKQPVEFFDPGELTIISSPQEDDESKA